MDWVARLHRSGGLSLLCNTVSPTVDRVASPQPWFEGVNLRLALHYLALGVMYCVNNQLAFACHVFADPGTYSIFKSCAPYLVAIFLRGLGDGMNQLQWVSVVLLCIAIMSTQYDDRGGTTRMSGLAYIMLAAVSYTHLTLPTKA